MNTAYFVKVSDGLTWNVLREKILLQEKKGCRPLPFLISKRLAVSPLEFHILSGNILVPAKCYTPYTAASTADSMGIWHCIFLESAQDSRNLLLYTAGRGFPLYASSLFP